MMEKKLSWVEFTSMSKSLINLCQYSEITANEITIIHKFISLQINTKLKCSKSNKQSKPFWNQPNHDQTISATSWSQPATARALTNWCWSNCGRRTLLLRWENKALEYCSTKFKTCSIRNHSANVFSHFCIHSLRHVWSISLVLKGWLSIENHKSSEAWGSWSMIILFCTLPCPDAHAHPTRWSGTSWSPTSPWHTSHSSQGPIEMRI